MDSFQQEPLRPLIKIRLTPSCGPHWDHLMQIYLRKHKWSTVGGRYKKEDGTCGRYKIMGMGQFLKPNLFCGPNPIQPMYGPNPRPTLVRNATTRSENMRWWNERQMSDRASEHSGNTRIVFIHGADATAGANRWINHVAAVDAAATQLLQQWRRRGRWLDAPQNPIRRLVSTPLTKTED